MTARPALRYLALAATLAGLSACDVTTGTAPVATSRPLGNIEPSEPVAKPASAATRDAKNYYARVEANYLSQELLRIDGGGDDTPFDARDLAENFIRVTFFDEFAERGGRLVPETVENRLHRWEEPVRLEVDFGPSVPLEQRTADRAEIAAYISRLSKITGLPIRMTARRANHTVLILNSEERIGAAERIRALAPATEAAAMRSVTDMDPETYCTVFAFTPGKTASYNRAITVIRGELPDRLRLACIHEELAQSLGLVADYPRARPSIFNDNEEFAALTRQDELMLKMLYDPRLRPGMTLSEARPIVEAMAAELLAGES